MIREIFDVPDGNDDVLVSAELFLRERIEELGGILLRKMEAHDFGEYPSFEAQFCIPLEEMAEEGSQDEQALSSETAELYTRLDEIHELYAGKYAKYL